MVYWIAQGFGILGLLVMVISLFQKNKDRMLGYVVFNGIFFGIEYLLLGAYSGMFSNFFGISFDGKIVSLLPIIAEIIYVIALWQKDVKKIRIGTLLMVILWLIYDIFVKAYPSMITDLIVMSSTIVAIVIKDILKRKEVK